MNRFWFSPIRGGPALDLFRMFFYATFFFIFLTDYYGGFFISLSQTVPELRQPTALEPLLGWFAHDPKFFWAIRLVFLAACAFSAAGFFARANKIIAGLSGVYILNTLASFGQWHHPGGLAAIALCGICLFPTEYRWAVDVRRGRARRPAPHAWYFRLLQVLTLWTYFSSGLYKFIAGHFGFEWVRVNSLYHYVQVAAQTEKVTNYKSPLFFLTAHEDLCWSLGLAAFALELLCPLALLDRRLSYAIFALLALFQFSIYFVMNENFVLLLPLLPALFWQAYAPEQDLGGRGQHRPT